ncbi:MAG: MFS transporter [Pseudobdellovibrionaceae bacterium]
MNPQFIIIFFTVFIYLVGFGMIIPLIPMLGRDFGASATQVGLLMAVFSFMQFIFAPLWGKLSDRHGRRPILLFCLVGEGLSYLIFAWSKDLTMLFIARILAGFFGASISTASAYISDITGPKERSKGMGMIGAAFGLGFVIGPAIGGFLSWWGGPALPPYFVAGLCACNFIFGWFYLKESLSFEKRAHPSKKESRLSLFVKNFAKPVVGKLMSVFFLATFAMACMEATLVLYVADLFNWGLKEVSFGFVYIGVISVFTQGYLIRKLMPKVGEKKFLLMGLTAMAFGLGGIGFAHSLPALAVCMTVLAFGTSFTNPSILGSISLLTSEKEQGVTLGFAQSMSALGRIIGPAIGGFLYGALSMESPFWVAGILALSGLILVVSMFKHLPDAGKNTETKTETEESKKIGRIGYFQLSNLHSGQIPYLIFLAGVDLNSYNLSQELKNLLEGPQKKAVPINEDNFIKEIQSNLQSPQTPVVILCEDEKSSLKMAVKVEAAGFINTYVVRGGLKGLISESVES